MDHKYLSYEGLKRFFYTKILKQINLKIDKTNGDISNTKIRSVDTIETKFPIPAAGETAKQFLGKVLTFLKNIKPLESNVTYYVSTESGSDSNDGTSAKPFKTIKRTLDAIPRDLGGFTATIQIADGTYDEEVKVTGYYNGVLDIKSQSNPDTLNTLCRIVRINISNCAAKVQFYGLYLAQKDAVAFTAGSCNMIYIKACQAIESATTSYAFDFTYTTARLFGCKCMYHRYCCRSYFSDVSSEEWISSSATDYGLLAERGGKIAKTGSQPSGDIRNESTSNGGMIVEANGTQIGNITYSGLSCTWGTVQGGYVRHGSVNAAMITVQIRVPVTVALTANQQYVISGFPKSSVDFGIACNMPQKVTNCFFSSAPGEIRFTPTESFAINDVIAFNFTYLTVA